MLIHGFLNCSSDIFWEQQSRDHHLWIYAGQNYDSQHIWGGISPCSLVAWKNNWYFINNEGWKYILCRGEEIYVESFALRIARDDEADARSAAVFAPTGMTNIDQLQGRPASQPGAIFWFVLVSLFLVTLLYFYICIFYISLNLIIVVLECENVILANLKNFLSLLRFIIS